MDTDKELERQAFEAWMKKVDQRLARVCTLTSQDLADQPYYEWFLDGLEPEEAAEETLTDEGFPF